LFRLRVVAGSIPMSFDDAADDRAFKRLSAQEARQLREKLTMVSPWRVVLFQFGAGLCCVVLAWIWSGQLSVMWSALYGALATVLPSALMARGMTRRVSSAVAAAAGFMFWEMLKIGVAIAMLVIAARVVPDLNWPALLLTMIVCIKVNWFALLWRAR
jgi:ATP synthase protein I